MAVVVPEAVDVDGVALAQEGHLLHHVERVRCGGVDLRLRSEPADVLLEAERRSERGPGGLERRRAGPHERGRVERAGAAEPGAGGIVGVGEVDHRPRAELASRRLRCLQHGESGHALPSDGAA